MQARPRFSAYVPTVEPCIARPKPTIPAGLRLTVSWASIPGVNIIRLAVATVLAAASFAAWAASFDCAKISTERPMKDTAQLARSLQMAGVSRCIAATVIMSAGLVQDPKIKASGPEIRNNNTLMGFYGDARKHLIRSMNNPAVEGAIDNMVRQQGEYFGNLVRFQGWDAFMPEYKQCRDGAYQ